MWTPKPNAKEVSVSAVGVKKFYCEHKHNFGLNLERTCDAQGRCLDMSIRHPGSESDCLAFVTSNLHSNLENRVF